MANYTLQDERVIKTLLGVEDIPSCVDAVYDGVQRQHHRLANGSVPPEVLESMLTTMRLLGMFKRTMASDDEEDRKHVGRVDLATVKKGTLILVRQKGNKKPRRARFHAPIGGDKVHLHYIDREYEPPEMDEGGRKIRDAVPESLDQKITEVERVDIAILQEV